MNMHKKERRLKEAMKLQRELNQLYRQERETPSIPLEEPIRAGWKRFFVVKKEHQGRNDFRELQSLVDRLNTIVVCRNRSFKRKDAKSKKVVDIEQRLRAIDQQEMEELEPKHFRRFFQPCIRCQHPTVLFEGRCHWNRPHFHFDAYHLLEFRVKPNYLTHMKVTDGDLASRKRQIYNRMDHQQYWRTLSRHSGHSYRWDGDEPSRIEPKQQAIKQQLDEVG